MLKLPKTISFSSLADFHRCSYAFKLSRIDGIYLSTASVDTVFGTLLHSCAQAILQYKQDQTEINRFERTWKKFCGMYKKYLDQEQTLRFAAAGKNALKGIRQFVEDEFGQDFEVLSVEEELLHKTGGTDLKFKGFVDLVILDKTNDRLVILDLKSCANSFQFKKYAGKEKERQLVFYKHFYCLKHDLDPKDVQTIFLLMEKDPKSKNPIGLHKITSGIVKVSNHLKVLDESLKNLVEMKIFPKNRKGCRFCPFKESGDCSDQNVDRW